jgi:sodium-dependent phosphate transporter
MEFAGATLVGSRVTDTIRTEVISLELFENDPSVLMLGMTCAIVGSATYLTIATRFTMPASTTHSIMGGVIGVSIAPAGTEGVNWSSRAFLRSSLPGVLLMVSRVALEPLFS